MYSIVKPKFVFFNKTLKANPTLKQNHENKILSLRHTHC
jgi:hypothetical protein